MLAGLCLILTLFSTCFLGSEFFLQLNEVALWGSAKMPLSLFLFPTAEKAEVLLGKSVITAVAGYI